ncbi:Nucleotidyl transferase [Nesidiocoris tenuis]|uniref:Nucleotidyl transferase n=1 Tax=Nesidiocoris tenuis TaxID=355587 RepID=A0ABN7AR49_9HEMI|nr:Nucleotidyl transferase [Nesidiocoris tenuis]
MLKAVILVGGPLKGTRFRPLSLDTPKPLFPVAGLPMIQHHIEACSRVPGLKEILILGYYPANDLAQFVSDMAQKYNIGIRYLQEFTALGTAGGLYHFRDQIRFGNPEGFFVFNGDVCADFPLEQMLQYHKSQGNSVITIMATETNKEQALNYGCIARHPKLGHMTHYVEKPSTFVSPLINCGIYFCSTDFFDVLASVFKEKLHNAPSDGVLPKDSGAMQLEQDVFTPLAGSGQASVFVSTRWWSQLKSAGAAVYANRHYLELYKNTHPERLSSGKNIIGDVFIDASAIVHPSAVIGPNVSIGPGANVGPGVRLKDALVLDGASIGSHTIVMHSIVGKNVRIGSWARVEGTPCDPNPNKPFAQMDNLPLFNKDGRLNPSITVLGCSVIVPSEVIVLNSIVLPHKELTRSFKYEIIL